MKVWIINHYATPPSIGRSTRHFNIAKQLLRLGHDVSIIAADSHQALDVSFDTKEAQHGLMEEGVQFLLLQAPNYDGNGFARIYNILVFTIRLLSLKSGKGISKPDVIIGSSVHPFAVWSAYRLARYFKVPFCFEVRDLWPQTLIDMGVLKSWHPIVYMLRTLEKFLYNRANKIIVLLPYADEYIHGLGVAKAKVFYLPNGVDVSEFPITTSQHVEKSEITVMYIGSHGQANSLDSLIEAAKLLREKTCSNSNTIRWRFVGDGTQKRRLQEEVVKLGLDNVNFEPAVSKLEVPVLMQEADILILNLMSLDTYKYGISLNKIFEYLASAKPIVFGCAARNNPIAEARAGFTVPPGDSEALANAVSEIVALSTQERNIMGMNGRIYVDKNHNFKRLGKDLDSMLREIL